MIVVVHILLVFAMTMMHADDSCKLETGCTYTAITCDDDNSCQMTLVTMFNRWYVNIIPAQTLPVMKWKNVCTQKFLVVYL